MKTRKELEQDIIELRTALTMIEHGDGPANLIARTALLQLHLRGENGEGKWQTLVRVRENNNTVPGAVTITPRVRRKPVDSADPVELGKWETMWDRRLSETNPEFKK